MILFGYFIGGFISGAFVTFGVLVLCAVVSIKRKQKKIKSCLGGVKVAKSPFKPYIAPINVKNIKKENTNEK